MSARIEEILEVLRLVIDACPLGCQLEDVRHARQSATHEVANKRRIGRTSAADKYQRQLGLPSTAVFDTMLYRAIVTRDFTELRGILTARSADSVDPDRIERFFQAI